MPDPNWPPVIVPVFAVTLTGAGADAGAMAAVLEMGAGIVHPLVVSHRTLAGATTVGPVDCAKRGGQMALVLAPRFRIEFQRQGDHEFAPFRYYGATCLSSYVDVGEYLRACRLRRRLHSVLLLLTCYSVSRTGRLRRSAAGDAR